LKSRLEKDAYFLAISGNSDDDSSDGGEWRIIVKKSRSLWDRVRGTGKIACDDAVLRTIEGILSGENDFQSVHREEDPERRYSGC